MKMRAIQIKYSQLSFFLILLTILSCNSVNKNKPAKTKLNESIVQVDSSINTDMDKLLAGKLNMDTIDLIVVQCANGYEYSWYDYDFNPVIERELNKFNGIIVEPFPYKKLMGVAYQGVFDKKYCGPIIERVNVDFLILTRFAKEYNELNRTNVDWGYELKIVNTRTLQQINSICAHHLKDYQAIEKHIKDNIDKLKSDIEKCK